MKAYVIYARKSSESEDRQVLSIDSQVTELKNLAAHAGVQVADVMTESKSAKSPGRPVFGDLMKRVWRGKVQGLLAWKIDRLARNPYDQGQIMQALSDGQIDQIVTVDRTYTRDGNDRFIGNFEFGIATKYIDDLSQNVRRGNRAKFAQGWINHNPPLGYLLEPVTKTIISDPQRFVLVRRMWDLILTGSYRPRAVVDIANREWGFRTRQYKRVGGRPMSASTLYTILENPYYMGLIRLRSGETYSGAHTAMVSKEEFERVQQLMGRRGRYRPQKHELAYSGLFRCGHCGAQITGEKHVKPNGRIYIYYRCTRNKRNLLCREPAVSEAELERLVSLELLRVTLPREVVDFCHDRVAEILATDVERREQAKKSLLSTLSSSEFEARTLLDLRLKGLVTDEQFVGKKQEIEGRSTGLRQKLQHLETRTAEMGRVIQKAFKCSLEAPRILQEGTQVQKRMILEAVGLNWKLKAKKVLTELKKPFQMMSETATCSDWSALVEDVWKWLQDTEEYFDIPDELMEGFETSKYHKDQKKQGRLTVVRYHVRSG